MPDNFLHAQYADILRRHGFIIDEAASRWTNPNALHIVVSYREDEYSLHGFAALPRNFGLRENAKFETALNSLLVGNSSRDKFKEVFDWVDDACVDLNTRYSHVHFYVRMNDKAEPVVWFRFNGLEQRKELEMQVAHSEYLLADARVAPLQKPKSYIVLDYMAKNGFYESLDVMPTLNTENSITYFVLPERMQNCALVSLDHVQDIKTIFYATKTNVVDDGNLTDDIARVLLPSVTHHAYVAITCAV